MSHPVTNRSIPTSTVIPELGYENVKQAADWLCRVFGLRERLLIGNHRAQLVFGDGAVIVTEWHDDGSNRTDSALLRSSGSTSPGHSLLVRVEDVDSHYKRARDQGAHILNPPTDWPYGERQYTAVDLGGHIWRFSQSIADVDPAEWGGTAINLEKEWPTLPR